MNNDKKELNIFLSYLNKCNCGIDKYFIDFLADFEGKTINEAKDHILSYVENELNIIIGEAFHEYNKKRGNK